jgi:transcriptional regulator with GAF, ATPase, and Fis domain
MASSPQFPARYEGIECLGSGGGGEVWSVRDRFSGEIVAFKLLREGASEAEVLALVREATLLSGLEGLDVPRVQHFGRLPGTNRAYMVRELVDGHSLEDLFTTDAAESLLPAVADAADVLTRLHRSLLLHGDVKPANIIVRRDGSATLVDLGLAAPWQQGGAEPQGLTPRFAAPELFQGARLTPRCEVFALGATLEEVLRAGESELDDTVREAVRAVADRATAATPGERFPSADEFAAALRAAAGLPASARLAHERAWVIAGTGEICAQLIAGIDALDESGGLVVSGASGSGRSTLLRRAAWSLGVAGRAVCLFESSHVTDFNDALDLALSEIEASEIVLLIDDADTLEPQHIERVDRLRQAGARIVIVLAGDGDAWPGPTFAFFQVPALGSDTAADLLRRILPALSDKLVERVVLHADGRPGKLRALAEELEGKTVVSLADLDALLNDVHDRPGGDVLEIHALLDRGRFEQAAALLDTHREDEALGFALARAKLHAGHGEPDAAVRELQRAKPLLDDAPVNEVAAWYVQMSRAHMRGGRYEQGEAHAKAALTRLGASLLTASPTEHVAAGEGDATRDLVADALSVAGLTQSLSGRHEDAARTLQRSVDVARGTSNERLVALALVSQAFALQRNGQLDQAHTVYEEALELSEAVGDAGLVTTTRLNLATVAQARADLGATIGHLEAAVHMGRRAGQASNVRQALLNLANLDLFLGRAERAKSSIDELSAQRESLPDAARAQLLALQAQHAILIGHVLAAAVHCEACAEAYESLGRKTDAAEAWLEYVLMSVSEPAPDMELVTRLLTRIDGLLTDSNAHRAAHLLARGYVAQQVGDQAAAAQRFCEAIAAAREHKQQKWTWRALEARSVLLDMMGRTAAAEQDRREALDILEAMATSLPQDLREVYWNEPRRTSLRRRQGTPSHQSVEPIIVDAASDEGHAQTHLGTVVREDRITRILEINRQIAGEHDLGRLMETVTDHAVALLGAERGFVLLRSRSGEDVLSVHAARESDGSDPHARFSRTVAARVVTTGEPFVATDATGDGRVSQYVSQHSLSLRSVACVPIRARTGRSVGALYLETRLRTGAHFREQLPILIAFADQVAIAIETARLVGENQARAEQLAKANEQLEEARQKLEQALGRRTEQLAHTRRNLRTARAALRSHFGYQGIVGTSAAMRQVYAIIERLKDNDVPVLLMGESGTGKEVIARAIHSAGVRSKNRFVGVNCGAIPEHLLESELFGHERGAFTGADRSRKGLFRELEGGTLLLDEIGEMPEKMQASLLRVLQEKTVRAVGGTTECAVDARVIAATHRNLDAMVADRTFREDLYYRLNVIPVAVPALRQRRDDIPLLIDYFLRVFAARYARERRSVSREAMARLMDFPWPGNVRQLENVLLNAWILSDADELGPEDFEFPRTSLPAAGMGGRLSAVPPVSAGDHDDREKTQILQALEDCGWNRAQAAKAVGMPRRTFYRRLKKYGVQ